MFVEIVQNVAIISFAAIGVYFVCLRFDDLHSIRAQLLLGGVFFLIAFLVTMTPVRMPDGATIDARAGPVILAGMIGGPISAIIAAIGGAFARSVIGGSFSFSGVLVFFFYAAVGSGLWLVFRIRQVECFRANCLATAAALSLVSAALMFFFISPREVAVHWITNDYPFIALANILSVAMSGIVSWIALRAARDTRQLRDTVDVLTLAQKASGLGIWHWDPRTNIVSWDETNRQLHRIDAKTFGNRYEDWAETVHGDDLEQVTEAFSNLLVHDAPFSVEYRLNTEERPARHLSGDAVAVRDRSGAVQRVVGVNLDITERVVREAELIKAHTAAEEATAQMQYEASHDALTKLHNRRALDLHLQKLAISTDHDAEIAFLQIDLDRFKSINDAFGHAAGDVVLIETGRFLKTLETEEVFVARFGGDEFCLVVHGNNSLARAMDCARAIIAHSAHPLNFSNVKLHFGASIGIATGKPEDLANIQVDADIALYDAKRKVGESVAVFDGAMREAAQRHKRIADGLRVALQEDQIAVYYQPKFQAHTRAFAGLEALVRWNHPTLGVVLPCEFLTIAEEIGLQHKIDRQVLRKTMDTAKRLERSGIKLPHMAINIGRQRLEDPTLLSDLDAFGELPCPLTFEVLETINLDGMTEETKWVLDSLQERGIRIELDDFGTGHASITSLLRLRPDGLKLDRSLIGGADGMQAPGEDLLKKVIDIGRASKITITAEGVETEDQAKLLERLGCDVLQGFHLAEPMCDTDLDIWLQTHVSADAPDRRAVG